MKRRQFIASAASVLSVAGFGGLFWPGRWKYIVIHHSAGAYGNIEFLQRVHAQRQPGDPVRAIPDHFIIGNGHGMKLGEIASDWRTTWNLWGLMSRHVTWITISEGSGSA